MHTSVGYQPILNPSPALLQLPLNATSLPEGLVTLIHTCKCPILVYRISDKADKA